MRALETPLPGVVLLEPRVFADARGEFLESYNQRAFRSATGLDCAFVQDNHSSSGHAVLRGLHYQLPDAQGKLVRAATGEVFDVAVDLRRTSRHFGRWFGARLSAGNRRMLWIPPGFAHGFLVLSPSADVLYKVTAYHEPAQTRSVAWNDAELGIDWPLQELSRAPVLSEADRSAPPLAGADVFA